MKSKNPLIGFLVLLGLGILGATFFLYRESQNEVRGLRQELASLRETPRPPILSETLNETVSPPVSNPPDSPRASALARLKIEPSLLDLGTVSKSAGLVKGTFKISNQGEFPLTLKYALSSCGCTVIDVQNQVISPGGSYDLKFTYDPNYFGPKLELGAVKKWIAVFSNDPQNPISKVYFQANVVP